MGTVFWGVGSMVGLGVGRAGWLAFNIYTVCCIWCFFDGNIKKESNSVWNALTCCIPCTEMQSTP